LYPKYAQKIIDETQLDIVAKKTTKAQIDKTAIFSEKVVDKIVNEKQKRP